MVIEVGNAIIIINKPVNEFVTRTEPVFHNEQGFLPAIPVVVHDDAQTNRVDLPTPFGSVKGGIGHTADEITLARNALVRVGGFTGGHVVAERHKVDNMHKVVAVLLRDV